MLHRAAEAPLQHRRASEKGADHRGGAASTMCRYMLLCARVLPPDRRGALE